jgi:hypothetical protein
MLFTKFINVHQSDIAFRHRCQGHSLFVSKYLYLLTPTQWRGQEWVQFHTHARTHRKLLTLQHGSN